MWTGRIQRCSVSGLEWKRSEVRPEHSVTPAPRSAQPSQPEPGQHGAAAAADTAGQQNVRAGGAELL